MTSSSHLVADLSALVGPEALVGDEDRAGYERGYRYGVGVAAAIVRPRDAQAVGAVVRYCQAQGRRLVLQGAHTGLVGAATPDGTGEQLVLSLERLSTITIDPDNRTATCGAGTRLSALNQEAAKYGLTLPIDLGADPSLGGMVATNTGGARLLRYGGMREQVRGLEIVLLDTEATTLTDLDGLRKNNIGIDLKQVAIGSGGKFGVVTTVQVELQPVVRQTASAIVVPVDTTSIPRIVSHLERSLDRFLTACEGMSGNAMRAALDHHPALRSPFGDVPEYALLVEAGTAILPDRGVDVSVMLQEALVEVYEAEDEPLADVLVGRSEAVWALRHAISDGLKMSGKVIGFDIAVRRDLLPVLRAELLSLVANHDPALLPCDFGHVADGGMHFNIVAPRTWDGEAALRPMIYDAVSRHGGSFSAEHGVGPANRCQYEAYRSPADRAICAAILASGDPQGLLT